MAGKSTDSDPIYLRGAPVVIAGIESQTPMLIKSLPWSFSLFLHTSSNEAFFKLRIPLSLRDKPKTFIYLFIWPQQICSLTKEEFTVPDSIARTSDRFTSRGTACLRFKLDKPAVLVVPKTCSLTPDTESDRQIIAYAQALAGQIELAICIPQDLIPSRLSHILKEEWLGDSWTASLEHTGLDRLYGGSGGSIHADDTELPSYDEVSQVEPPRVSGILGKRRRMSGEGCVEENETHLERICARLLEKQKADLLGRISEESRETKNWVGEQLKNIERQCQGHLDQRIAELEQSYQARFLALDSLLRNLDKACQDQHGKLDKQVEDLEQCIDDRVWVEVNELRTSVYEDFDDLRREHEEFIRDETSNAVGDLKLALSDAEVSFVGGRLEIT
ncbi:hypothetical protein FJTKL_07429 [Diaporthe vaccinii]|uniref:Uncharacterized protein n=1 Tax=Diaporthe vaccinii TaxID=105482 RepID=A0ABR4EU14_9PEZI